MSRLLAAALVAVAVLAPTAHAGPCFGVQGTGYACVNPENVAVDRDGGPTVGDCFYLLGNTCVPVFVTAPSVTTTGPLFAVCRPSC